jgi:hypothetical protein
MSRRQLVERWFNEVWVKKDGLALTELLAPSASASDLIEGMEDPCREYPLLIEVVKELTGPLEVEILQFFESGEWTSTRYLARSDGPDGATPICAEGIVMMRFEGDRIAELSSKFDSFTLFEQLGQLPKEALVACLSGQKLTWA